MWFLSIFKVSSQSKISYKYISSVHSGNQDMMTSSNQNLFLVSGLYSGEYTGDTQAIDAELWCFLSSAPEKTVEQITETPTIWDVTALIMMSLEWIVMIPT